MYDITHDLIHEKILRILSYGKQLEDMEYRLDHYTPKNIGDSYLINCISAHILYVKYLISEFWGIYLEYLKDREDHDDHDVASDCFYYRSLSDNEKIIEVEFFKVIEECRKLW